MDQIARYAVYYAPRPGGFAEAAAQWLGRDAETGACVAHAEPAGLPLPLAQITQAPRKYAFHGTIKAPFRLAAGRSGAELAAACADLAQSLPPARVTGGLVLQALGGFLALTPAGDDGEILALGAEVVRKLDLFRAPLNADEVAKRRPDRLSPRQRALLDTWGYPYVMEEFRFHLTLTDDLPPEQVAAVAPVAQAHFAPHLPRPFVIEDLCLYGAGGDGNFRILHRYPLTGG